MEKDNLERIPTGIPGFDEMIEGGIEKSSTVLVIGGCGSGKSTLCMQYIINGCRIGQPGVYVSMEESPDKIKKHMRRFGWDLEKYEKNGLLRIIRIGPKDALQVIKEDYGQIANAITDLKAERMVIDSISSLESLLETDHDIKENAVRLVEWLNKKNCTTLIISESEETIGEYTRHGIMEFVVDGVIVMYNMQKGNVRENALEVLKMRGTKHLKMIVPFKIDKGIEVFPHEQVFGECER
ncbi:MAG: ATPase domain-containing protein [Candidatus Altiarchaeota archaeon]